MSRLSANVINSHPSVATANRPTAIFRATISESVIRTIEKITDLNLTASARGKAYFNAGAKFSASYKKEKWEPLITSVGSLSQQAQWLDRQPFQNGDKYFSVILKVRKPERNLAEFLNTANIKSKKDQIVDWIDQDKRQIVLFNVYFITFLGL